MADDDIETQRNDLYNFIVLNASLIPTKLKHETKEKETGYYRSK